MVSVFGENIAEFLLALGTSLPIPRSKRGTSLLSEQNLEVSQLIFVCQTAEYPHAVSVAQKQTHELRRSGHIRCLV